MPAIYSVFSRPGWKAFDLSVWQDKQSVEQKPQGGFLVPDCPGFTARLAADFPGFAARLTPDL